MIRAIWRVIVGPRKVWVIHENPDELGYYAIQEEHW